MTDPTPARRLLRHAYQELALCGVVWLVAMVWTLGTYVVLGYRFAVDHPLVTSGWVRHPQTPIPVLFGFPDWVFLGIIVPWVLITAFTVVYCLWWMPDDDLGQDVDTPLEYQPPVMPAPSPPTPTDSTDSTDVTRRDTVAETPRHDH